MIFLRCKISPSNYVYAVMTVGVLNLNFYSPFVTVSRSGVLEVYPAWNFIVRIMSLLHHTRYVTAYTNAVFRS